MKPRRKKVRRTWSYYAHARCHTCGLEREDNGGTRDVAKVQSWAMRHVRTTGHVVGCDVTCTSTYEIDDRPPPKTVSLWELRSRV